MKPPWRTSDDPPFSYTGLDFSGPLNVKEESKYNQRSIRKSYIALFTCASTRATHLEQLPSLSTEGFLQAFRRFSSRRGLPRILISDNAKTLIQSGEQGTVKKQKRQKFNFQKRQKINLQKRQKFQIFSIYDIRDQNE